MGKDMAHSREGAKGSGSGVRKRRASTVSHGCCAGLGAVFLLGGGAEPGLRVTSAHLLWPTALIPGKQTEYLALKGLHQASEQMGFSLKHLFLIKFVPLAEAQV